GARLTSLLAIAVPLAATIAADGRAERGLDEPLESALVVDEAPPPAPEPASSSALTLAALDRRIRDLDAEEEASKRELGELGGHIAAAHARSLARGRAFYRLTRAGMLPVGGGFGELVSHAL